MPYLNVTFPVQGTHLPADHGYLLYAAMTRTLPALHGVSWLGIELISGIPWDKGLITLPAYKAYLRLRLPAQNFAEVLPLAGKRLDIAGYAIRL
jgi:CRISPR-associated protein Cas6